MSHQTLADYIKQRCRERGLSLTVASQKIGFSRGYLPSIVRSIFTPSREKVIMIAQFFGDSSDMVLPLAGYHPEEIITEEDTRLKELHSIARRLSNHDLQLLLQLARTMKSMAYERRAEVQTKAAEVRPVEVETAYEKAAVSGSI